MLISKFTTLKIKGQAKGFAPNLTFLKTKFIKYEEKNLDPTRPGGGIYVCS